jgi:hypothetical protein
MLDDCAALYKCTTHGYVVNNTGKEESLSGTSREEGEKIMKRLPLNPKAWRRKHEKGCQDPGR